MISLPKLSHRMYTDSVGTHPDYGGTNGYQWFFLWWFITLESYILGRNTKRNLSCSPRNIILYQWNGLGNYILELVLIGNIHKNMSPCLCQDICRVPCMNINTKFPHSPIMHRTNGRYQIMGKNSVGRKWEIQTYPPTWIQNIYTKGGGDFFYYDIVVDPHNTGSFRHIRGGAVKINIIQQRICGPFTWLSWHKTRCQIKITFQRNYIAQIQWFVIPIRIIL